MKSLFHILCIPTKTYTAHYPAGVILTMEVNDRDAGAQKANAMCSPHSIERQARFVDILAAAWHSQAQSPISRKDVLKNNLNLI